ncbi:MAG: DUF4266 domain-containing protein [Burkholderiales bacterium]
MTTPPKRLRRSPQGAPLAARQSRFRGDRLMGTALLLWAALSSGCAIQPWVKPYERERLADPIMSFSRSPLADKHAEHVRNVREGARGATGVQGGGCGCN